MNITTHLNRAITKRDALYKKAGTAFVVTLTFEDTDGSVIEYLDVIVKNYTELDNTLLKLEKEGHTVSYSCRRYEELMKTKC